MPPKNPTPARMPAVSGAARRISDSEVWRLAGNFTQIVWRASADGQQVIAPTWTIVTGQSQDRLQDGGWLEQIHPEDREHVAHLWSEARRLSDELIVEFRLQLRDGHHE